MFPEYNRMTFRVEAPLGEDEEIKAALENNCGEVIVEAAEDFAEQFTKATGLKRREDGILLVQHE